MQHLIDKAKWIRETEYELLDLFQEGKIHGTIHTCIGQEFSPVCLAETYVEGDYVFSNHRCHGHWLAFTGDKDGLVKELMGQEDGVCGGRGGSQHLSNGWFFSSGIQGGMTPIACGVAMGLKSTNNIVYCFIGDGTMGQGVVYEAFNMAALFELPILFVLEDNGIAQTTPKSESFDRIIRSRIEGFGLHYFHGNTDYPELLIDYVKYAVEFARRNEPSLLHILTNRLHAHSKGGETRSDEEVKKLWDCDYLNKCQTTDI